MRAILIDPEKQTVTEVEFNGNYKHIYDLIGCETFTVVGLEKDDGLYVDDEGLFKSLDSQEPDYFFIWKGYAQPLAGKGLILGANEEGDSIATKLTVEEVKAKVSFDKLIVRDIQTVEGTTEKYGKTMPYIQSVPVFERVE